jgi:sRNA-binding carbon storage regulator CsrA
MPGFMVRKYKPGDRIRLVGAGMMATVVVEAVDCGVVKLCINASESIRIVRDDGGEDVGRPRKEGGRSWR